MEQRLDVLMVSRGLAPSREKAKELIKNGQVQVGGKKAVKPSLKVGEETLIEVTGDLLPFVSRGGLKLLKGLQEFRINLEDRVCMDVGASTGGFTDCMLQKGAKKVYAVDVGTGQLRDSLREDPRVLSMEQTNIRDLKPEDLDEKMDFMSIDVSFISLDKVLPPAVHLLKDQGEIVCLIKPQFEAGRGQVNKKGVVRDPRMRELAIRKVLDTAESLDLYPRGLTFSPIRGPEGNVEFLLYLSRNNRDDNYLKIVDESLVRRVVNESARMV